MFVGGKDTIKPDRMVLRWLARHGADVDATTARTLIQDLATHLSADLSRRVTAGEIDHRRWAGTSSNPSLIPAHVWA